MVTLRVNATGSGMVVNWRRFKEGVLEPCTRLNCLLTTVLTDVVTDLLCEARRIDPQCIVQPLFPNGFTTTSFDIAIRGNGFHITCGRRLVRGWFPLNPLAPEFGRNFDVFTNISADTPDLEGTFVETLQRKYRFKDELNSESHRVGTATTARSH